MRISRKIKAFYVITTFFSALLAFSQILKIDETKKIIDLVSSNKWNEILKEILLLGLAIVFCVLVEYIRQTLFLRLEREIGILLKEYAVNGVLSRDNKSCIENNPQEEISEFNNDIEQISNDYYLNLLDIIFQILSLAIYSVFLFCINPIIAVIILIGNIMVLITPAFFSKKLQVKRQLYLENTKKFNVVLADFLKGQIPLRTNLGSQWMGELTREEIKNAEDSKRCHSSVLVKSNISTGSVSYLSEFILYFVGVIMIFYHGITVGGLVACIQISDLLVMPTTTIAQSINDLNSISNIRKKFIEKYKERKEIHSTKIKNLERIEFKNVSVKLDNGFEMKNITLTLDCKKKYLICGENGSGKSTLIKLLTREVLPRQGEIYVNGIQLNEIDRDCLFTKLGIVFQNSFLLNNTLLNNIKLGRNIDEDKLKDIFLQMNFLSLKYEDLRERMYEESSGNISGGEKQKLCLMRTLAEEKDMLVFDEALSAMDKESREKLENLVLEKEIGFVYINHINTPEFILKFDKIIVFSQGSVSRTLCSEEEKKAFANTYA